MIVFIGSVFLMVGIPLLGLTAIETSSVRTNLKKRGADWRTSRELLSLLRLLVVSMFLVNIGLAAVGMNLATVAFPFAIICFVLITLPYRSDFIMSLASVSKRAKTLFSATKQAQPTTDNIENSDDKIRTNEQSADLPKLPSSAALDSVGTLTEKMAHEFRNSPATVDLAQHSKIYPKAAEILSSMDNQDLDLSGLHALGRELAISLIGHNTGSLKFDGIQELPNDIAVILAGSKAKSLSLNNLTELSDKAVEALSWYKGDSVFLSGISNCKSSACMHLAESSFAVKLSPNFAFEQTTGHIALAVKQGRNDLRFITSLSPEQAQILIKIDVNNLNLDSIDSLDVETASTLATFKGNLHLNGITSLDDETFTELMKCNSTLSLPRVRELSDAQTYAISQFAGKRILLRGISDLSAAQAAALAVLPADVELGSDFRWRESAGHMALASKMGVPLLANIERLGESECESLSKHSSDTLLLDDVKLISTAALRNLADFQGNTLSLSGLKELPEYGGKALSEFKGTELALNSIESLDTGNANGLAHFQGVQVWLLGLTDLSEDAARALAQSSFDVYLPNRGIPASSRSIVMQTRQKRKLGSFAIPESDE